MNKDVIYIEPEDDITDIIAKIEKSKEKIVALVPPKKAGVFRSLVNIKLISKAGATAEKSVVLVTIDPSITKLAAATKMPVAKNLQSAPVIPETTTEEPVNEHTIEDMSEPGEEAVEKSDKATDETGETAEEKEAAEDENDKDGDEDKDEDEDEKEDEKSAKKSKKAKKSSGGLLGWIKAHKVITAFGCIAVVGLIGFLIWAFGVAPAVDVTVSIKTDQNNFSEMVNFTENMAEENAKEGKLYLEQKKLETTDEVTFEATGKKNQGEKASGDVIVYAYFKERASIAINSGSTFSNNGLAFISTENVTLAWNGEDDDACDNAGQTSSLVRSGCQISARIKVTAANPGSNYNIGATNSGWSTVANVAGVYSDKAMAGGTDSVITVVQQSDIEKAKSELITAKADENKEKLYQSIGDNYYIIDVSFEQSTSATTSTPAADQEVTEGVKPKLSATTTATVYAVEKSKIEDFIKAKADLESNQEVYEIKDIYIESFGKVGSNYAGRLKAQYYVGPKITESEVVDKIRGRGLGDAQREIRDIYGVSDVKMDPSYPWVTSVPIDSNKVTVRFEVKDQDGQELKAQSEEQNEQDEQSDGQENKEEK